MPPPAEEGRGCSARISDERVRARPRAGGRMCSRVETMVTRRLSTIGRRTFPPRIKGDGDAPREPDLDFFSGADIELARFILQGEGSGAGTAPYASGAGTSFNWFGPPNEMYDVFLCSEQTMDHIAHEYRASCAAEDAVYRPGAPLQPHHDQDEQRQGFQYYQPSQQPYIQPSPHYHTPSPQPQFYASTSQSSPLPPHDDPSYHSAPEPSPHQIVRPRAQWPQRDRQPPPCGTSSRLHHRPAHGSDRD
ncbi:hypothetical protein PIB30_061847 [Stylosanthes scabra]|uniref:Uncharacterized protein n=1 Tax=Stylosanthes scabra TaxID=79078 RepID=A0ABU6TND7_9FABA|nr:hypothetical protein [Stylosanthes scabra]